MTRDYKHVSTRSAAAQRGQAKPPGRGFPAGLTLGLALGLTLGAAGAASVHFYHVLRSTPAAPAPVESRPAPQPAARDEERHDYDFFRILREMEVVVPEPEEVAEELRPVYVLQAGSFKTRRTAEFLQEKLRALDLESEVQRTETDDGAIWYRVRLGPYDSLSRVNNIRINLRKQGIESLLKKR